MHLLGELREEGPTSSPVAPADDQQLVSALIERAVAAQVDAGAIGLPPGYAETAIPGAGGEMAASPQYSSPASVVIGTKSPRRIAPDTRRES
jgi:hypothetical protein